MKNRFYQLVGGGALRLSSLTEKFDKIFAVGQVARIGFTLAEVLITLGVIGIVAAITMPSIIEQYREKVTITRLQQTYNILQQATQRMIQDEGYKTIDYFGTDANERIAKYAELLPKYLNVTKVCALGDRKCAPFKYEGCCYSWGPNTHRLYLNNGVMIMFSGTGTCQQDISLKKPGCSEYDYNCEHSKPNLNYGSYGHRCGNLWVDVNGMKGPNASGKDFFRFIILQDGILPEGLPDEVISTNKLENICFNAEYKGYCTGWIIHNKNMDYLRCSDKLGWDKASSCKD